MECVHPKETCEQPSRSWGPAPPPRATPSPAGAPAGTSFCIRVSSYWPWDLGQGVYLSEPGPGLVWSQEDEPWAWPLLVAGVLRVGRPSFLTLRPVEPCSGLDWMEVLREPSSAGYGVGAERSRKSWAVESFALSPMLPGARETPCLEGGLLVWSVQEHPEGVRVLLPGPGGLLSQDQRELWSHMELGGQSADTKLGVPGRVLVRGRVRVRERCTETPPALTT